MKLEKEILNRGYVTHMLTNEDGKIYGMEKDHYINWELNEVEKRHKFYWSECYVEANCMACIIRKGELLVEPTAEQLEHYHEQSKVNFI